jgi:hypothetical protein
MVDICDGCEESIFIGNGEGEGRVEKEVEIVGGVLELCCSISHDPLWAVWENAPRSMLFSPSSSPLQVASDIIAIDMWVTENLQKNKYQNQTGSESPVGKCMPDPTQEKSMSD